MRIVGIIGGVDTHVDNHVAAAINHNGGLLGVESSPADQAGFEELLGWLVGFGELVRVGVEGTGSWGVGLSRFLADHDVMVVEVDRPNRQKRRKQGSLIPLMLFRRLERRCRGRRRLPRRAVMAPSNRYGC